MKNIIMPWAFFVIMFNTFSAQEGDFSYRQITAFEKRLDVKDVNVGRDYIFQTTLKTTFNGQLKSIISSCSCIQLLEQIESVSDNSLKLTFSLKTVRERTFKVYLDLNFKNGKKERFTVTGISTKADNDEYISPQLITAPKSVSRELYISANRIVRKSSKYFIADLRTPTSF